MRLQEGSKGMDRFDKSQRRTCSRYSLLRGIEVERRLGRNIQLQAAGVEREASASRCFQSAALSLLHSGRITRPTTTAATTRPPASRNADAALCTRAPVVNVSSTRRMRAPRTSAPTRNP